MVDRKVSIHAVKVLGTLIVIAIAVGAFEPFYIRMFFTDRARLRETLTELPYTKAPGLRTFLVEVERRTPRGSRVAIAAPTLEWDRGYEYVLTRSMYPLAGREVLKLPEELPRAEYIAAWHAAPHVGGFREIWRGRDGVLLQRVR
jgi:hypothetical protein